MKSENEDGTCGVMHFETRATPIKPSVSAVGPAESWVTRAWLGLSSVLVRLEWGDVSTASVLTCGVRRS